MICLHASFDTSWADDQENRQAERQQDISALQDIGSITGRQTLSQQ